MIGKGKRDRKETERQREREIEKNIEAERKREMEREREAGRKKKTGGLRGEIYRIFHKREGVRDIGKEKGESFRREKLEDTKIKGDYLWFHACLIQLVSTYHRE